LLQPAASLIKTHESYSDGLSLEMVRMNETHVRINLNRLTRIVSMHSESEWQTIKTFAEWPDWLGILYPDEEPIWLILGAYSVHRQETIPAYAEHLRIHLLFIPQD
jgi:hypothetical protein